MTKISIIICVLASLNGFSQNLQNFTKHNFTTPTDTLPYRLLHPELIEQEKNYPLVLFLHGSGERGNDNEINLTYISELFLQDNVRKDYPGFVLVPQCPSGESWSPDDWYAKPTEPIATVMELVDSLTSALPIDSSRLYVIGLSMGGYGTWYLITRYEQRFAAAVPICGGGDWNQAHVIRHVPLWIFHGRKDKIVLPEQSRKMVRAIKRAGGKPRYTEYKKAEHESWKLAFKEPDLLSWLFSQRLFRE